MTFNATKSVSVAREVAGPDNAGDPRIEEAHREAVAYAMGFVERDMQARVRTAGRNENRTTGNLVAYRVTHRDTRVNLDTQIPRDHHHDVNLFSDESKPNAAAKWAGKPMPDPQLHDHCFIFNAT